MHFSFGIWNWTESFPKKLRVVVFVGDRDNSSDLRRKNFRTLISQFLADREEIIHNDFRLIKDPEDLFDTRAYYKKTTSTLKPGSHQA